MLREVAMFVAWLFQGLLSEVALLVEGLLYFVLSYFRWWKAQFKLALCSVL